MQAKPKPKSLARNTEWATSGLDMFSESDEDEGDDAENLTHSRLNVLHPDSPYGLIQHVISPSLPKQKPSKNQRVSDLGGLTDDEVWLSDGDLLILKGGTTSFLSNSIDDSNPFKYSPTSNPIEVSNKNTPVAYADSGKIAIAPAPPSVVSNYGSRAKPINLNQNQINHVPLTRVPKHIGSKLEPFVPKNAQIPWPNTRDKSSTKNIQPKTKITHQAILPVQNKFIPSEPIRKQDSYSPSVHQYKIKLGTPYSYDQVNAIHTGNSLSVVNSNRNTQPKLPFQTPVSPVYTTSHNVISSNAISLPSATNPIIRHLNSNNNRKIHSYQQAPVIQYQQQTYQRPRNSRTNNPLLEYLKRYSIQNKQPLSSLTGNSQHRNYGQAVTSASIGAGSSSINASPKAAQQRSPKAFSNIRDYYKYTRRNYDNPSNPYYSTHQTSVSNNQHLLGKTNHRTVNPKPSTNYIRKKTPFLDYLTYIKPYFPMFS